MPFENYSGLLKSVAIFKSPKYSREFTNNFDTPEQITLLILFFFSSSNCKSPRVDVLVIMIFYLNVILRLKNLFLSLSLSLSKSHTKFFSHISPLSNTFNKNKKCIRIHLLETKEKKKKNRKKKQNRKRKKFFLLFISNAL